MTPFALNPLSIASLSSAGSNVALALAILAALLALPQVVRLALGFLPPSRHPARWRSRVVARYRKIGMSVWIFAACKLRLDPLFDELRQFIQARAGIRSVLDVGCGYGIPGCALLEWLPEAQIYGLDPAVGRVKVAATVFGPRGLAVAQGAPDINPGCTSGATASGATFPTRFDLAMVLDVIYFLSDEALASTLRGIRAALGDNGYLFLRAVIPPSGRGTLSWRIEMLRQRLSGFRGHYRSIEQVRDAIVAAGFVVEHTGASGGNRELAWYIARAGP